MAARGHSRGVMGGCAAAVLAAACLALPACSDTRETYTQTSGDYVLAMRTDPEPPEAGKYADVSAVLHYQGRAALAACPIKFRQYPADHPPAAAAESDYRPMRQALTSGIYNGESAVFSSVGKWIIEFHVECSDVKFDLQFPVFVVKAG